MEFTKLKAHIKQGRLYSAYHIFGDDPYLVKYAQDMFFKHVTLPEFNISVFQNEVEAEQIINALSTLPVLADYRLVSASLPLVKDLALVKEYLCSTAVLLLLNGTKPALECEPIVCDRLDNLTLLNYIKGECNKCNCTIENEAAQLLIEYSARQMGHISNGLSKLTSYDKAIDVESVRALVVPVLEYRVFELTDAIVKHKPLRASQILDDMLDQTGGASKTFGLIYSHFRRLMFAALALNAQELSASLNIKEFAAKSAINQASHFSKPRLKYFLDKLADIDFQMKTNGGDKMLLQGFIYQASIG